ncbi:membrane protein [Bradyrhizobium sp. WSM1743]|uniref:membrane protein n=1 Tax=Bradyrhizobium sp. WSM1743 TaxID=318996 RepID=UPI000482B61C|nr:membrane protein [Bradyrhizobium sp. WSM1743]
MTNDTIETGALRHLDHRVNPEESLPGRWRIPIAVAVGCGLIGLVLRYLAREHATADAAEYITWYTFARNHGIGGLAEAFTNYTPFYSYLLLIATRLDGLGQPLSLVKMISAIFEFGCAIVVAGMVWRVTKAPLRASLAFCTVWLAPTVLFNGAMWGQADSIWTFFVLVSVAMFMRDQNGVLPFAVACSVKAQGVFLGPFALGMILRRKIHLAWLTAIPGVYAILAIPVLVAGRSLVSVLGIYLDQANTFHRLTMNAANVWVFAGATPYAVGVTAGLVLAAASGLALSIFIAQSRRTGPEFILLVACVSLVLMPYLLPKMHERYFYGFELACIALACLNLRYLPFAVIAQVDGVLSYLAFESGIVMGLLPAALCNTFLVFYLVLDLRNGERGSRLPRLVWLGFIASTAGLFSYLLFAGVGLNVSPAYMLAAGLAALMTLLLVKESRCASTDGPAPSH